MQGLDEEEERERLERLETQVLLIKIIQTSFEAWEAKEDFKATWCFEQAKETIRDIQASALSGRKPSELLLMRIKETERELRSASS